MTISAENHYLKFDLFLLYQVVMSLDEQNPLRLQVYRKAIGVEDALIEKADLQGMNGNLHIISKALSPSNFSAGDILRRDGNFR